MPDEKKNYTQDAKDGIPHKQRVEITPDGKTTISGSVLLSELFKGQPIIATTAPQEKAFTTIDKPEPTLHKQARGYMRTAGALVGKDMERTLFTLPTFENDINPYKETFTKNTGITGNLLIQLWQKNKDDDNILTINNLSAMAETLQVSPQELKLYLIYLGGYQYPKITHGVNKRGKKIISIYSDKLFYIKFNILYKDGETANDFTTDDKIGTNYCNFIKDRAIDTVEISPSQSIQEDLMTYSRGLGNVLVDDGFIAFSLGLSDLSYKLLNLTGSHRPSFKIRFEKLISQKYLNLEKQTRGIYTSTGKRLRAGKGKPKILARIQEALQELLDKGHLIKYHYNEEKDLFSWTYSSKIIKHKELLPLKTEQTRQDKTTP